MNEGPSTTASVLAVLPLEEDYLSLRNIFTHSNWKLLLARTIPEAQKILKQARVGVVIAECWLPDGQSWKDLLREFQSMQEPPMLIVTSHLADDRLWAEVLNFGAYDVLMKPFDLTEVFRISSLAWRHWSGNAAGQEQSTPALPPGLPSSPSVQESLLTKEI